MILFYQELGCFARNLFKELPCPACHKQFTIYARSLQQLSSEVSGCEVPLHSHWVQMDEWYGVSLWPRSCSMLILAQIMPILWLHHHREGEFTETSGHMRQEHQRPQSKRFVPLANQESNRSSDAAKAIRDQLCHYLVSKEGEMSWQWKWYSSACFFPTNQNNRIQTYIHGHMYAHMHTTQSSITC